MSAGANTLIRFRYECPFRNDGKMRLCDSVQVNTESVVAKYLNETNARTIKVHIEC